MKLSRLIFTPVVALTLSISAFAGSFNAGQVKQIQQIVHNYLIKNPQVLVEASQALQAQQQKQMQKEAMKGVKANKKQLFNDKNSPSVGSAKAPVTLVEFFDYQCGHCRAMAPVLSKLISGDKNIHVVFKELPIFGGNSQYAATAALASVKQGKYYAFHNALFSATGPLDKKTVLKLAKQAGLNTQQLQSDMKSPAVKKQIQDNFKLAQSLKIQGTPTFVLSNNAETKFQFIPGATSADNLKNLIKSLK